MEIVSVDSVVNWFVQAMATEFRTAYERAENMYHSQGDMRMAKRAGAGVLGKWYNAHTVNAKGQSLDRMLKVLKPHNIKLPAILTNKTQKEEMQYSSSGNLIKLIGELRPVLEKKGYKDQAGKLAGFISEYNSKMNKLSEGGKGEEKKEKEKPKKSEVEGGQKKAAEGVVMDTIKRLPKEVQHEVRMAVARRGNTLAALADELKKRDIKM